MAEKHRLYSDDFKRRAVARMTASSCDIPALAEELGVSRTLLYRWRKQYAAPPLVSPSRSSERGPGGEVAVGERPGSEVALTAPAPPLVSPSRSSERGPGGEVAVGEGARGEGLGPGGEVISAPVDELDDSNPNARLRQSLLDTAFTLTHAIREATENAPLNQLSAALGLVIDRLLKLEAQTSNLSLSVREELIRIEYKDSDGSLHHSPPWARGDPAFEDPVSRGRVRSPFWENRDGQADDPGDGPARG